MARHDRILPATFATYSDWIRGDMLKRGKQEHYWGEVDIAYVKDGRFWPVEIKWTGQLRPKTLKQIGKYANSRILARQSAPTSIGGIPVEFLPQALLRLGLEERT